MDNKANDWILSTMANPSFAAVDFINAGITSDNTSIYDRDRYLNSGLILNSPEFLSNGKFDKAKFNSFYDLARSKYQDLATETSHPDTAKAIFSYNNVWVSEEERKKGLDNKDFEIKNIYNPDRRKFGIERIGYISDPTMTPQEIAQTLKVWDPATKTWSKSPNDAWLFRNWFEPVALATWDFDADINGNPTTDPSKIYYLKGQPKVNEETGTYYYEKLNGKEPYGKLILSPFDILTTDGSVANQYDFFDSDGLTKSFVGSLAKNAMRIAPLFIPYVNTAYIAFNIADEMAKVLPIIYKSTFGLGSDDNSLANTIEAFAMLFENNKISEEGLQNFFNSESLLNMVSDVALLLYEQRWLFTKAPKAFRLKLYDISKGKGQAMSELEKMTALKAEQYEKEIVDNGLDAIFKLGGKEEILAAAFAKSQIWAENYIQDYQTIGRNLSRYFMAGTSSFLAFLDAKEEGASDLEAAALFWGYFSGMYTLMGTDIGEHILPELRLQKQQIKDALVLVARGDLAGETVNAAKIATETTEKVGLFKKMFNKGTSLARQMHERHIGNTMMDTAKSIGANMLAEGTEEVSEELLYDLTRSTFNIISEFTGGTKVSAWDNALERYGQSFFGGLLGGGIFEAGNTYRIVKPKLEGQEYDPNNIKANQQLIYQIRNGQKEEILNSLNYLRKHKMLGNANLGSKITGVDKNGDVIYSEATNTDNLNEAAYQLMLKYINNIETVLDKENMNMSDEQLLRGDGIQGADVLKYLRYNYLMGSPVVGKLLQDYNNLADEFLTKYNKVLLLESVSDELRRSTPSWQEDLDLAKRELEETRKKRDEYFDSENQLYYTGLMLFSANQNMAAPFAHITLRDFAEDKFKKKFNELTEYEQSKAKEEYQEYLLQEASEDITKGYNFFMKLNKKFGQLLTQLGENSIKYVKGRNSLMGGMAITIPITNPETGVTEEKQVTLPELYLRMFGKGLLNDEQIVEKAKELAKLVDPFNVMRRFTVKGSGRINNGLNVWRNSDMAPILGTDLEENLIDDPSLQAKLKMLQLFRDNLQLLARENDGYVDELFLNTILEIKRELTKINPEDLRGFAVDMYNIPEVNPEFINAFEKIKDDLTADNLDEKLASFFEEVKNLGADQDILDLLETIERFKAANQDFLDLNAEINNIALNVTPNPIYSLLNDLIVTTTGEERNVILLINEASKRFNLSTSSTDISKFVLDGDLQYEDFENALLLISLLQSLIRAALTDNLVKDNIMDFNRLMNNISGTDELGEIDVAAASTYYMDLEQLKLKVLFIMLLHDYNSRQSLVELTKLGLKLDYISFNILGNPDSEFYKESPGIDKQINGDPILDSSILDAIEKATTLKEYSEKDEVNLSEDILVKMAQERMAIENAVYDRIHKLLDGKTSELKQLIYETLFSKYKGADISVNTTALSTDMDVNTVGPMAEMCYLMSIIGCKSGDFHYNYKKWIDSNNTNIIPLPAQRANILFAWAAIHNPEMVEMVTNILGTEKTSHIPVPNAIFLLGVSGAGKTSAVMMITYLMLKAENPDSISSITTAPLLNQATKLSLDINVDDSKNKVFNKEKLFKELLGVDIDKINDPESWVFTTDPENPVAPLEFNITARKLKGSISDGFNTAIAPKYIFIDEVTFFSASELYALGEYCKKTGTLMITTGDLKLGTNMKSWKVGYADNLVDTIGMTMMPSPWELTCSMRPSNTAKRDNNNITTLMAEKFDLPIFREEDFSNYGEFFLKVREEIFNNAKIKGAYSDNGLRGDILRERPETTGEGASKSLTNNGKQEVVKTIKDLILHLKEGEKIAYIYDAGDTSIKEFIETSGEFTEDELLNKIVLKEATDFFTQKDILGSERKYCIIDINWELQFLSKFGEIDGILLDPNSRKAIVDFIKTFNTMISRSINGSIIYDNGLSSIVGNDIFLEVDDSIIKDIRPNMDMLLAYNSGLLAIYLRLLEGYTPTIPVSPVASTETGTTASLTPAEEPGTGEEPAGSEEPETGETPNPAESEGVINPEEEGFSAPPPGEDDLGHLPEPDNGPLVGPEIFEEENNLTLEKEIKFSDFFRTKILELGLEFRDGKLYLGNKIVVLVKYSNKDNYNRFKNTAKLDSKDRYTIVDFEGIDGLRNVIELSASDTSIFSILLVDPSTIAGNDLRSTYELFVIDTSSIPDAVAERTIPTRTTVKVKENGKDIYYFIAQIKDKHGKKCYKVKISESPDVASLLKEEDGFKWCDIPTGIFLMKVYLEVEKPTPKKKSNIPAKVPNLNVDRNIEVIPVTDNEIYNLIKLNGDLGLKLYSGLATQSTSLILVDASGNVVEFNLGTNSRNGTTKPENLELILAPFITYTLGTLTNVYNPKDHYIRTILVDGKSHISIIDRLTNKPIVDVNLPSNFNLIYNDALDLLTNIRSTLIDMDGSNIQEIKEHIYAITTGFYRKFTTNNRLITSRVNNLLGPKNSFKQIDYKIKVYSSKLSTDPLVDSGIGEKTDVRLDSPSTLLVAHLGNFELGLAKLAHPLTMMLYVHMIKLYSKNNMTLTNDEKIALQNSINRLKEVTALAFRLRAKTFSTNGYTVNGIKFTGLDAGIVEYYDIQGFNPATGKLTGALLVNSDEATGDIDDLGINYHDFINLPGIICSRPIILTDRIVTSDSGVLNKSNKPLSHTISGKPAVVFTLNKNLYYYRKDGAYYVTVSKEEANKDGIVEKGLVASNPDLLITIWKEAYTAYLNGSISEEEYDLRTGHGLIRYALASPESVNFSGYLANTIRLVNNIIKKSTSDRIVLGNLTTGTRLLHTLFNLLADLVDGIRRSISHGQEYDPSNAEDVEQIKNSEIFVGNVPEGLAYLREGKITLSLEEAKDLCDSINSLLSNCVRRIHQYKDTSKEEFRSLTIDAKDLKDIYGIFFNTKIEYSEDTVNKLRKGLIELIKSSVSDAEIDLDTEIFDVPFSANTGATAEAVKFIGLFSKEKTWTKIPFSIANFFAQRDEFSEEEGEYSIKEDNPKIKRLIDFLDLNLELYASGDEDPAAKNPLNKNFFYNAQYLITDERDTASDEIAYLASSIENTFKFRVAALTASLHLSKELTDKLLDEVKERLLQKFNDVIGVEKDNSSEPMYFYEKSDWNNKALKNAEDALGLLGNDSTVNPITPIMGTNLEVLPEKTEVEKLAEEVINKIKLLVDNQDDLTVQNSFELLVQIINSILNTPNGITLTPLFIIESAVFLFNSNVESYNMGDTTFLFCEETNGIFEISPVIECIAKKYSRFSSGHGFGEFNPNNIVDINFDAINKLFVAIYNNTIINKKLRIELHKSGTITAQEIGPIETEQLDTIQSTVGLAAQLDLLTIDSIKERINNFKIKLQNSPEEGGLSIDLLLENETLLRGLYQEAMDAAINDLEIQDLIDNLNLEALDIIKDIPEELKLIDNDNCTTLGLPDLLVLRNFYLTH